MIYGRFRLSVSYLIDLGGVFSFFLTLAYRAMRDTTSRLGSTYCMSEFLYLLFKHICVSNY